MRINAAVLEEKEDRSSCMKSNSPHRGRIKFSCVSSQVESVRQTSMCETRRCRFHFHSSWDTKAPEVSSRCTVSDREDHVVLSYPSCLHCRSCRSGRNYYCEHLLELCFGGSRLDGSDASHGQKATRSARLIECFRAGVFPVDQLIRHCNFEDINRAIPDLLEGSTIKAALRMDHV